MFTSPISLAFLILRSLLLKEIDNESTMLIEIHRNVISHITENVSSHYWSLHTLGLWQIIERDYDEVRGWGGQAVSQIN